MARRDNRLSQGIRVDGNNPNYDRDLTAFPTKAQIIEALKDVPDDAYVLIKTHDWGWPRWNWTIRAWWKRGGQKPTVPIDVRQELLRDRSLSNG